LVLDWAPPEVELRLPAVVDAAVVDAVDVAAAARRALTGDVRDDRWSLWVCRAAWWAAAVRAGADAHAGRAKAATVPTSAVAPTATIRCRMVLTRIPPSSAVHRAEKQVRAEYLSPLWALRSGPVKALSTHVNVDDRSSVTDGRLKPCGVACPLQTVMRRSPRAGNA
jgi:hypothetical protein